MIILLNLFRNKGIAKFPDRQMFLQKNMPNMPLHKNINKK